MARGHAVQPRHLGSQVFGFMIWVPYSASLGLSFLSCRVRIIIDVMGQKVLSTGLVRSVP